MSNGVLVRSALLGAAAGGRSVTPLAALAAHGPRWMRAATAVAAFGEIVVDKLPQAPSRLAPALLGGRALFGAVAGAVYARRHGSSSVLPAVVAAVAAVTASYAGARWRSEAARRSLDLPAALAEDAVTVTLAWAAARR
jgi:uncharacterized membrane protein